MSESNDIELRSEKVRKIIGKIPSLMIRLGISVITLVFLMLLAGAYLFTYDSKIEASSDLHQQGEYVNYKTYVPYEKLKELSVGQKISFSITTENSLNSNIQHIDSILIVTKENTFVQIQGSLRSNTVMLKEPVKVQTVIYTGKTNILNQLLGFSN